MSIDVLSEADTAPIIVGDAEDMAELRGVGRNADGQFHLLLNSYLVQLAPEASKNFSTAKHLLLVSLSGDQIATARRVNISNLDNGNELSANQRNALATALSLGSGSPRQFRTAALAEFSTNYPDLAAA